MGTKEGISLFARKPHYRDHVLPIWRALPDDVKNEPPIHQFDRLLIAGGPDIRHGHPYVYVEHGAGQWYEGVTAPGYAGGDGHQGCELFICPSQIVADRWTAKYPQIPTAVVGCPKLDPWHAGRRPEPHEKTVAITFHWDCKLVPETRSAFPYYEPELHWMVDAYEEQGWTVIGHAHPRTKQILEKRWHRLGVEFVEKGSDVLDRASVLVADHTSLMAEFMSLGRPVVALNAPWYRREVTHGQRFWDWDVTYADDALEASRIDLNLLRPPEWHPYAYNDGQATQRAAQAIVDLIR
jgi:hypothetical protein